MPRSTPGRRWPRNTARSYLAVNNYQPPSRGFSMDPPRCCSAGLAAAARQRLLRPAPTIACAREKAPSCGWRAAARMSPHNVKPWAEWRGAPANRSTSASLKTLVGDARMEAVCNLLEELHVGLVVLDDRAQRRRAQDDVGCHPRSYPRFGDLATSPWRQEDCGSGRSGGRSGARSVVPPCRPGLPQRSGSRCPVRTTWLPCLCTGDRRQPAQGGQANAGRIAAADRRARHMPPGCRKTSRPRARERGSIAR